MLSKISMNRIGNSNSNYTQASTPSFKGQLGEQVGVTVKYLMKNDIFTPMEKKGKEVIKDLLPRIGANGQFLNWVRLPEAQLKRVDYIYDIVDGFRNANKDNPLIVRGIGGSKHTLEHLVNMFGLGEGKVKFYSDIDPISFNKFNQGLPEGKLINSADEVVSKSGTTFEIEDSMLKAEQARLEEYRKLGLANINRYINSKTVAVTDAGEKSKLRRVADEKGYLGKLYVHDDVGGRYSALDDHGLFTLAYAGMSKKDMIKMLEGASEMTWFSLLPKVHSNPALQKGIFYADSVKNGINDFIHALFGRHFEGGTENWLKQFHGESLKDTRFSPIKCPDGMHYYAEAIFDPRNKYNITGTAFDTSKLPGFENYTTYVQDVVMPAFANVAPTSLELLKVGKAGLAPETLGAWTQLKNFETIFKGMMRRSVNGEAHPAVLDEVLQPSVEAYKKSAFKPGTDLIPGR